MTSVFIFTFVVPQNLKPVTFVTTIKVDRIKYFLVVFIVPSFV